MQKGDSPVTVLIEECIQRPAAGAWERLIGRLQPVLASAAYRVAAGRGGAAMDEIDDIVQKVCMKLGAPGLEALRRVPRDNDQAALAYLRVMAINAARDHFKTGRAVKRGGETLVHVTPELGELAATLDAEPMEKDILLAQVDAALSGGRRERTVFWLYYRQGFTAKEISAIPSFGLSAKGVESLLHRLTTGLRAALGPRREEPGKGDCAPEAS